MCGGMQSAQLKFNVAVDTIIGTIEEGTHGICGGFFFPGTGDYFPVEPDDPRVTMVKVQITEKDPGEGMFPTIEVMPRVEVLVPIEVVDINEIVYEWIGPPLYPHPRDPRTPIEKRRVYHVKTFDQIGKE